MSVATEFPPDVYIPAAARPRSLRSLSSLSSVPDRSEPVLPDCGTRPAAPAAAAIGAGVVDLDRWRHHDVGAQVGGRRRNASDLRIRPAAVANAPMRLTRRGLV